MAFATHHRIFRDLRDCADVLRDETHHCGGGNRIHHQTAYIMRRILFCIVAVIAMTSFASCDMDTEYLGHYVTSVEYTEFWDEWVEKTCTRTVHDGYDENGNEITHEEEYDCSYVERHYPQYVFVREDGDRTIITEEDYKRICRRLGTQPEFVDLHRDYYRHDGDKYITRFNGDRDHMWTLTESHRYKNKVMGSKSVFNFSDVDRKDREFYKLYDYPESFDWVNDENPIIGYKASKAVIDSFRYVNAYYGGKYQFRCYVMVWKNAPMETATMEQSYLVGGNKNELVTCISINDAGEIQWVYAFSWEDTPYMTVGINHLFEKGECLDLMKLNRYILANVPTHWKRKEFKDFEYINH